jgi:hypothetical protein
MWYYQCNGIPSFLSFQMIKPGNIFFLIVNRISPNFIGKEFLFRSEFFQQLLLWNHWSSLTISNRTVGTTFFEVELFIVHSKFKVKGWFSSQRPDNFTWIHSYSGNGVNISREAFALWHNNRNYFGNLRLKYYLTYWFWSISHTPMTSSKCGVFTQLSERRHWLLWI